jgi:aryl-alcohol dehydrogenase-like predicted oxidoreductase
MGQRSGVGENEAARVVRDTLDAGMNFFDTAEGYDDSELRLGRALRGVPRDDYVLATKYSYHDGSENSGSSNPLIDGKTLEMKLERSLDRLGVEYVDIYQAHGVLPERYSEVVDQHVPQLLRLKETGKIRFLGVTESGATDKTHRVIARMAEDGHFDTAMVTYNLLNQNAERTIFPQCERSGLGMIVMMAVRRALSRPARLEEVIANLKSRALIKEDAVSDRDPLGWLVHGDVESVPAAAYRYALEPAAVSTVLTGTANAAHLTDNIRAVEQGPLPRADRERLQKIFGHLDEGLGN